MKFDIFIGEERVETLRAQLGELELKLIYYYKPILISGIKELRDYYMKALENRSQGYQDFNIPYINIHFDINDLGFISGLAFILILVTLDLNLIKEKENIEIAFETSKMIFQENDVKRRVFIQFMSLNQYLCITSKNHEFIQVLARNIFLYMPIAFSILIFQTELHSIQLRKMLNSDGYSIWMSLVFEVFSVLSIFILTIFCLKKIKDIDKIWKAEVDEVNELKKTRLSNKTIFCTFIDAHD